MQISILFSVNIIFIYVIFINHYTIKYNYQSPGIELPGNENLQFQNWLIYDLICDEVYYDFWVNVF